MFISCKYLETAFVAGVFNEKSNGILYYTCMLGKHVCVFFALFNLVYLFAFKVLFIRNYFI